MQYPVTSAYAFTDYCSQGQTISHVIVDIVKPPRGGLNLFNLYIALSRSSGHDDCLAEFDKQTMTWWKELTMTGRHATQTIVPC
ncbi:hypothetical protein EDD16DRAFT_1499389 [Pisolithus croceorrhizus]|nr:hypothetical protein EDD16DRAFT_1499389 [Pisolithus croceorrhizus]